MPIGKAQFSYGTTLKMSIMFERSRNEAMKLTGRGSKHDSWSIMVMERSSL